MDNNAALARIRSLPIWQGSITTEPLGGGLTNVNYVVTDAGKRYVVRLGDDIPEHHVMRFNELAASRAAHAAGISPAVIHAEGGLTVLEFIDCKTLNEADVRAPGMLEKIVPLVRACHVDIPRHLRGASLFFGCSMSSAITQLLCVMAAVPIPRFCQNFWNMQQSWRRPRARLT